MAEVAEEVRFICGCILADAMFMSIGILPILQTDICVCVFFIIRHYNYLYVYIYIYSVIHIYIQTNRYIHMLDCCSVLFVYLRMRYYTISTSRDGDGWIGRFTNTYGRLFQTRLDEIGKRWGVQFQTVPNIYVYHVAGSISKYIQLCARQILYLTKLIPSSRPRYLLKITMVICMYVYIHYIYIYMYVYI